MSAPAPHVVGLGEAMLRLSAPSGDRLEQAAGFAADVGGAELNALVAAVACGLRGTWLTRLADNPIGQRIAAHAAARGVRAVVDWDADARAPLYFVEHGVPPRPSEVLYDRADSAMTRLAPAHFDWSAQLADAHAAVATGITCALGAGPAAAVAGFLAAAREAGVRTVFDVNHRSRLWSWETALPVLRPLLSQVSVLAAGGEDLARLLGREDAPLELARAAIDAWGCDLVLLRSTTPLDGRTYAFEATVVEAHATHASGLHEAVVVDAFGGGDAALGAFLSAWLLHDDLERAADDAAWACAFQHTTNGDAWLARPADRRRRGETTARVLR